MDLNQTRYRFPKITCHIIYKWPKISADFTSLYKKNHEYLQIDQLNW